MKPDVRMRIIVPPDVIRYTDIFVDVTVAGRRWSKRYRMDTDELIEYLNKGTRYRMDTTMEER